MSRNTTKSKQLTQEDARGMKTLFHYFSKATPASVSATQDEPSPKRCRLEDEAKVSDCVIATSAEEFVWAKLEGHPWWPGLLQPCKDTSGRVNVKFFGDDSTGLVHTKYIDKFTGSAKECSKGSKYYKCSKKWTQAVTDARNLFSRSVGSASSTQTASFENLNEDLYDSEAEDNCDEGDSSFEPSGTSKSSSDSEQEYPTCSDDDSYTELAKAKTRVKALKCSEPLKKKFNTTKTDLPLTSTPANARGAGVATTPTTPKTPVQKACNGSVSEIGTTPKTIQKTSDRTVSFLSSFSFSEQNSTVCDRNDYGDIKFKHLDYEFLHDGKRRDKGKRLQADPDFDPTTLYIPPQFLEKQTPAMKQWWVFKGDHFDTILLFKMGKFYELFHMDCVIAVKELSLSYMKSKDDLAHCGFPEIAYGRFSDQLVERGYKVARIEQVETPQMLQQRNSDSKQKDKVVKRELCRITTVGTKTYSFIDGDSKESLPKYLIAVCESSSYSSCPTFGVCFVDTSTGRIQLGQFVDDEQCSRLRTMISHYPPSQVLFPRNQCSKFQQLLKCIPNVLQEALKPGSQFLMAKDCLTALRDRGWYSDLPSAVDSLLDQSDCLKLTPARNGELALSSFGAAIWYLKKCLIEEDVLSLKNIEIYQPIDLRNDTLLSSGANQLKLPKYMIVDGTTLQNLDVLNLKPSSSEWTLLRRIDFCSTPFGKRLLRHWICAPLCSSKLIRDRQEAVKCLLQAPRFAEEAFLEMRKMPDLERLLQKINTLASKKRNEEHPDSRAILFDQDIYNKRKIQDFISALEGFKSCAKVVRLWQQQTGLKCKFINNLLTLCSAGGVFPDIEETVDNFFTAFDHEFAKKNGVILPEPGFNVPFDESCKDCEQLEDTLKAYLQQQRKKFGCKVEFADTMKNRYQLEIPEAYCHLVTDDYTLESQRKGFRRYKTVAIERMVSELTEAEERKNSALKDNMRTVFAKFIDNYENWKTAVEVFGVVDVLLSFSKYAQTADYSVCQPDIIDPSSDVKPFIAVTDCVHPCAGKFFTSAQFIPNSATIGGDDKSLVLLTGPNMGGKSTLMRQLGLVVILAQIGCHVPAASCSLTPVDRIFTRIGASDNLMSGQSTFYVELSECSAILRHATANSFVIMDELGRGTATYDGAAVAGAVLRRLAENVKCRAMFSTHYHHLVNDFAGHAMINFGHMACAVENENNDDPTEETVTFLYRFVPGACQKSYGFHAAKLAGIDREIIRRAYAKSQELHLLMPGAACNNKLAKLKEVISASKNNCTTEQLASLLKTVEIN